MDLTIYNAIRPKMQTGDVILWRSESVLGSLIRLFSKARVNHASLVIRFTEYDTDRVYVLEALATGIVLRALSERLENHKGQAWWYQAIDELDCRRKECGGIALCKVGTRYDYKSLFQQIAGHVSVDANRFFCSEYVRYCWDHAGVPFSSQLAPQPGDLAKSTFLKQGVQL